MAKTLLSVIIPFFNEEQNLQKLHTETVSVLDKIDKETEIIYVDDGSTDNSLKVLTEAIDSFKKEKVGVKLISLKKNSGQTAAIAAGIDNAQSELISFLDADLQNDPNDIPRFLKKIEEGYDAVFGFRRDRKDTSLRRYFSGVANRLIQWIFNYPYKDVGCSARIVKKEFLTDIKLYGELHRVLPVLVYLEGAKATELIVVHRPRTKGYSKYGFERIVKTVIDIFTVKFLSSYGTKPAYVFGSAGLFSILISFFSLLLVAYRRLFLGTFVHRDPIFLIAVFFGLVGIQLVMMGLLAELQIRTYFETQKKSIYKIKNIQEF